VIKTPGFYCRGHGFDPWSAKFCLPRGVAKKKKEKGGKKKRKQKQTMCQIEGLGEEG